MLLSYIIKLKCVPMSTRMMFAPCLSAACIVGVGLGSMHYSCNKVTGKSTQQITTLIYHNYNDVYH